ncbi:hypothetical protein B4U79_17431, partial [Dinothrombium tinctorium]
MQENQKLAAQMIDHFIVDLWRSNILYAAAKLDIADYLSIKPMKAEELAPFTNANADSLSRFLRALTTIGYAEKDEKQCFRLTPKGNLLRSNVSFSFKHVILFTNGDLYTLWSKLDQGVKSGKRVAESLYGVPFYDYINKRPNVLNNFCKAVKQVTRAFCQEIPQIYDFTQFKHIIDLAGNDGEFLSIVLAQA